MDDESFRSKVKVGFPLRPSPRSRVKFKTGSSVSHLLTCVHGFSSVSDYLCVYSTYICVYIYFLVLADDGRSHK